MHKEGLVITRFGSTVDVEDAQGIVHRCHSRKMGDTLACGDRVIVDIQNEPGVVLEHLPRSSLLQKPDSRGKMKPIAANVDVMILTIAPKPLFSEYLIDRYLVAAHHLKINAAILLNKIDLMDPIADAALFERLNVYRSIGYPVLSSSIYQAQGLHELIAFLNHKTAVFVGPSGVGKSSIISALIPEAEIKLGNLHAQTGLGRHTTTASRLYHLPQEGRLIDSPGVRDFDLGHLSPEDILKGFIEFKPFLNHCKFRNCQHNKEPDCALKNAVSTQKISESRLMSYRELANDALKNFSWKK